ncbi:MAG: murein biosynthesis integral membrane protein MurJ [Patescibacteria group bacterium]
MLKRILNVESKFIISAALMIGFFSLLSRVLGILRNRIFTSEFGAGDITDIYFSAFVIPDLIYNIFIIGAIGIVFIPIFFEYSQKSKEEAMHLTNIVLNILILFVILIASLFAFFAQEILSIFLYGFSPEKIQTTVDMTRIMLLSPIFLGISSILGNFIQAHKRFLSFALAPVLYNIGIICGVLFFVPNIGLAGLAYGVIFGAFLHLLVQLPTALSLGFKYKLSFDIWHPGFRKMIILSIPRVVGLLAHQLNFMVIIFIGSSLSSGSISIFNFANDLQYIPIGIIAFSFVTAVFPFLSESYSKKDMKEFLNKFYSTVNQILFLVIPISVFLILERAQIVRVLYGAGEFSWDDTKLTAAALGLFAMSIFAQSLIPLFSRTFFAMANSKTPVFINVASLAINIGLSFFFVGLLKDGGAFRDILGQILKVSDMSDIAVLGLPLAFSIASIINILWLYFSLSHKIDEYSSVRILYSVNRINISVLAMGVSVYPTLYFMANIVNMHTFLGIFLQGIVAFFIGSFVYFGSAYLLKIPEFFVFSEAFTLPIKRMFLLKSYTSQVNGSEKL